MASFPELPNELLIQILAHNLPNDDRARTYEDDEPDYIKYARFISSSAISRRIYAAAKEAFWQPYVAELMVGLFAKGRNTARANDERCIPDVDFGEDSGGTMIQRCRQLKIHLMVYPHLRKAHFAEYCKRTMVEYLKQLENLQTVEVVVVIRDGSIRDEACKFAKTVLEELCGAMGKQIKGVITVVEPMVREPSMRSRPQGM